MTMRCLNHIQHIDSQITRHMTQHSIQPIDACACCIRICILMHHVAHHVHTTMRSHMRMQDKYASHVVYAYSCCIRPCATCRCINTPSACINTPSTCINRPSTCITLHTTHLAYAYDYQSRVCINRLYVIDSHINRLYHGCTLMVHMPINVDASTCIPL